MNATSSDVVVIGGGIAGVSAAFQLSADLDVVLLEREAQLAHHTTGRSAAVYIVNYGGPFAQRLTLGSRPFYESPPPELVDGPIMEPIGLLSVGTERFREDLERQYREGHALDPTLQLLGTDDITELLPVVRPEFAALGTYEPGASVMDVMGLHQAYVRGARANATPIERYHEVTAIERRGERWHVITDRGTHTAEVVVNAAGAWGDVIAGMAGAEPVGLQPMRRTAFTVGVTHDTSNWPFALIETDEGPCYFKHEAGGQLLCSPADEVPSEPCDARAEELDVAMAIERINTATTLDIRSVRTTWAGLRSFVPDRQPVLGMDPDVDGFCWMVGQGGTGITTSHASGRVVAAAVSGRALPPDLAGLGLELESLGPRRL